MRKKEYITHAALWLLLLFTWAACSSDVADSPLSGHGEGRLSLNQIEVELSVMDSPSTKGTPGSYDAPQPEELTYTITSTSTTESQVYSYSELMASPVLPVGHYTLTATYGTASMGTTPYLYYSTTFTIQGLQTTTLPSFSVPLACAIIRPSVTDLLPHFKNNVQLSLRDESGTSIAVTNLTDYYVPAGKNYTLTISGTNQLGESKTVQGNVSQASAKTRYILNCSARVPIFSMPNQPDYNAWSYHIDFTPLTASQISDAADLSTDKILNNLTYEYSADGGNSWQTFTGTRIANLTPNTTYTFRARFGAVYSTNQVTLTTEGAKIINNGDMESWNKTKIYSGNGTYSTTLYCDYCTNWATRNERTTKGGENASGFGNYGVDWRWYSGTIPSSDAHGGSQAAEISTLAFYNSKVSGRWKRSNIFSKIQSDGTAFIGYLFLGSFDKDNDSYTLGIAHCDRPSALSFYYKYSPISSDQCKVKAYVYDINMIQIASLEFTSNSQDDYIEASVPFIYSTSQKKAAYISVFFQSGTNVDITSMNQVNGSYNSSPYVHDRIVGSILKVDDIKLIYD